MKKKLDFNIFEIGTNLKLKIVLSIILNDYVN